METEPIPINEDAVVQQKLYKQKVIESFKSLYPKVNEHIIEQFFDFCTDPNMKEYNDYLYLTFIQKERPLMKSEYNKWKKLNKQYKKILFNTPETTPIDKFKETNMELKGEVTFQEPQEESFS